MTEQASSTSWHDLVTVAAHGVGPEQVLGEALPALLGLTGAVGAVVVRRQGETWAAVHAAGEPLEAAALTRVVDAGGDPDRIVEVPQGWHGVTQVACRRLPGHQGVLALAWRGSAPDLTSAALDVLGTGLARVDAEERYADLAMRVDNAQMLANMGDYDWHIESDTNQWSDQLFRIYGHEPQAFNPSYERFLSFIHPEDQTWIQELHQRAYATGEPYAMTERIVRPDGEVRYLSSNGQVIIGEDGLPVRMRGTCIDITDRVLAEQERERSAAALREGQVRRRQAIEINDNVVQGLSTAVYAMRDGDTELARSLIERTLHAARLMMSDLLEPVDGGEIQPGDLVRSTPSRLDEASA